MLYSVSSLFVLSVVSALSAAEAPQHVVPDSYPTIQAAIDAASAGDIVFVKAGTYSEALQFKDGITLQGEDREKVVVKCSTFKGAALTATNSKSGTIQGIAFQGDDEATSDRPVMFPNCTVHLFYSDVKFTDCIVRDGMFSGIFVIGGAPVIEKCLIENNAAQGIYCCEGSTRPTINSCVIRENKYCGIVLRGDGLLAVASENQVEGNQWNGFYVDDPVTLRGHKNDYSRNGMISKREIGWLLWNKEYKYFEAIAKRLREERSRTSDGSWQLAHFYSYLTDDTGRMRPEQEQDFVAKIDAWKTEFPDSVVWRIVLAQAYYYRAWAQRGTGFAYTVTGKGWQGYEDYMDKAWDVMESAAGIEPKDPEYYCLLSTMAMEAPRNRGSNSSIIGSIARAIVPSKTGRAAEDAFLAGIELEPLYFPLYYERARQLLPRWHGSRAQLVQFAEESADRTHDLAGDTLYAIIASSVSDDEKEEDFLAYGFTWKRIAQGFEDHLQKYPDDKYRLNKYASLACVHRDQAKAANVFDRIGSDWDESIWGNEEEFKAHKDWALGDKPFPAPPPLQQAIVDGDGWKVAGLLNTGADPESKTSSGETMLILAVRANDSGIVEQLLDAGADPNYVTSYGDFALHQAMWQPTPDCMRLLLERGAKPNQATSDGWTPLTLAIDMEHPKYAEILLMSGADPNFGRERRRTALNIAIERDYAALVELLLARGADPNFLSNPNPPALFCAIDRHNVMLCNLLLEHGADPDLGAESGTSALVKAIQAGDQGLVQLLLDRGADPGLKPSQERLPLTVAAGLGNPEICRLLIDSGADPAKGEDDNWCPLFGAARSNNVEVARLLVERGADVSVRLTDGWTPFHRAAKYNCTEVLNYLLELRPEGIHGVTEGGRTLLHEAARGGHIDLVKFCIEKGLDVNAAEKENGKTALQYAIDSQRDDIAALLREHGATQ
ncbi:MAG: ankyrin repeat domain-containing protein [Candidatus Hydrogenedentes bacterium]|nr:ankyrin repeat domain-containing protein [Candidatus Hydrogenedentota bacterium]